MGEAFARVKDGLTRPAPGSSSGNGGGGFKWLRHAADPKRKDFEASGMAREVPHTVATSRDKPFRGASRSLWKPLAGPLGRLLDRCGRLVAGLWSILGRLGGFVGGCEALHPDSESFQYIFVKILVPSWIAKNVIFKLRIKNMELPR